MITKEELAVLEDILLRHVQGRLTPGEVFALNLILKKLSEQVQE